MLCDGPKSVNDGIVSIFVPIAHQAHPDGKIESHEERQSEAANRFCEHGFLQSFIVRLQPNQKAINSGIDKTVGKHEWKEHQDK